MMMMMMMAHDEGGGPNMVIWQVDKEDQEGLDREEDEKRKKRAEYLFMKVR